MEPASLRLTLPNGETAIYDADDHDVISAFRWYMVGRYPCTIQTVNGKRVLIAMYELVMGGKRKGLIFDHINRNPLDNRKSNLRFTTRSQNQYNRTLNKPTKTSAYKGVYWSKRSNKWQAQIGHEGRKIRLGVFVNEADAARAYNTKATELYGSFAALNVLEG